MGDDTDHDQLFKEVIREFFPDFMNLFFPEQAARYDLDHVAWLNKELFADPPDGGDRCPRSSAEIANARPSCRRRRRDSA